MDFLVHLRTVHFTLILVCAVTLISLQGVSPGELDHAQEQMHQVRQIKAQWKEWIARWSHDQIQGLDKMGVGGGSDLSSFIHVCPESGKRWRINLKGFPIRFLIAPKGESGERVFADSVRKENGDLQFYSGTDNWPNTLKDFKSFWDHSGIRVQIIQALDQNVHFLSTDEADSSIQWTTRCSNNTDSITLELRTRDTVCSERVLQRLPLPLFCADVQSENLTVAIPVRFRESRTWEEPRSWLATHYSLPNSAIGFEQDFRELNQITALYMDLPIDRVAEILKAEIQRSGERVQMLGLTLSLNILSQAAAGIVLLVQIYLVLHLKQFQLSSPCGEPIAWIAIYENICAKLLTLATSGFLPVATCLYSTIIHPSFFNGICSMASFVLAGWSAPVFWGLPNYPSVKIKPTEWPG